MPEPLEPLLPGVWPPLPLPCPKGSNPGPNGFWSCPEPVLPAAPEVMIVTTAGLTFAAAAATLPSAGVGASLDDPAVSTGAEEAGVT